MDPVLRRGERVSGIRIYMTRTVCQFSHGAVKMLNEKYEILLIPDMIFTNKINKTRGEEGRWPDRETSCH